MAREEAEIKELSKKLAQNPDSMVFVQLADVYRRAGDLEKSVEVCLQGLERHPTYTTARAILGRDYLDLGKLDEAATQFRQIEIADTENVLAHRMLGQIALAKGQFAEAIARQQRVLALDPDDTTAQDLLQQALEAAHRHEASGKTGASAPAAAAKPPSSEQSQALKVADIYIKKRAFDEAIEVIQEILSSDPANTLAQQKLKEIKTLRGDKPEGDDGAKARDEAEAKRKAEEEAKAKADEEAKRKAEEEAKAKADEEAKRKAEEEARAKADEEAKRKAEEEARARAEEEAKRKAEEEARAKAEEEAKRKAEEEAKARAEEESKRKAEEEAKARADEEARAKAEEEARRKAEEEARAQAEAEAKRKAVEDARAQAEAEAKRKAVEEAHRKAEEEARRLAAENAKAMADSEGEQRERKSNKLSSDDIFSVIAGSADDLIENEGSAAPAAAAAAPAPAAKDSDPEARRLIEAFLKAQDIEASMLLDSRGAVIESKVAGDAALLGQAASAIFHNTEKAAMNMRFGGLRQIMIVGQDSRQILFVALRAGTLVAVTGRNTNLGLLRVAVNDLAKRA